MVTISIYIKIFMHFNYTKLICHVVAPTKPQRKNNIFNAELDDLLLELLLEQVAMGRKGDRGFKDEAYVAVANAMTAASTVARTFTLTTIRNRCTNLKK